MLNASSIDAASLARQYLNPELRQQHTFCLRWLPAHLLLRSPEDTRHKLLLNNASTFPQLQLALCF